MRVAIYARFSSDLQDKRSIEDQVALCRDYAARKGWTVVEVYADHAVSGASVHGRHAFERMLVDARHGNFAIVLAEDLDRLSRNQADSASLYEDMIFLGVAIETVADGAVNEMHIGLKGTMSAMFLRALALKTHRGQAGRVRAGKSAGGRCYGYVVTSVGDRAINEAEAEIIRRVFADTIAGVSPRALAAALNAERVPSPRAGLWNASTIHGHARRGTGILRNELYAGRIVWNRQRFVKNPDTGRRVSRPNTSDAVMRTEVPQLRIVSEEMWTAVQAILAERSRPEQARQRRRPKHLLSGLLRCGACGGAYIVAGGSATGTVRFCCSARRQKGVCTNARLVAAAAIEERILAAMDGQLLHEDVIAAAVAAYIERRRREDQERERERGRIERRLGEIKRALARQMDEIEAGRGSWSLHEKTLALEAEHETLTAQLGIVPRAEVVRLHPATIDRYRAAVRAMRAGLSGPGRDEVVAGVRELIDSITVYPRDDTEGRDLELTGQLAGLLQPERLEKAGSTGMGVMVAGARFELTTFRL